MKATQFVKRSVLVFLVATSMLLLAACGDSQYVDALNKKMDALNQAVPPLNDQINKLSQDNTLLGDQTWQNDATAAVDKLDTAGKDFANLPPAPDRLKDVDALVKELAFEINSYADTFRAMIQNQDINQLNTANSHMDNINNLIKKIDDAIAAANNQ